LLKDFNISAPSVLKPYFPLKEKDEMLLRQKVGKLLDSQLIVIHAGASCPSKRWPAERFGEVARFFQQKYGFQVVLVGGEETKPFSEQITHCLSSSINLTAQLSLGELAQLLKKSVFLLSNDSGPVHMASAVEKPVVSIFGRKEAGLSPTRWRPLGEKSFYVWKDVGCELCLAHQCQINFLCLTEISAQEVIQTIEEKILKSKTVSI
jgi:ADP-heptose:LPS heptosyltransferase